MPFILKIVVTIFCIMLFFIVGQLVAKERLLLKYSLLWLLLAFLLLIGALFPVILADIAHVLGFEILSNFIFFVGLCCLLAIVLSLSVIVSKQTVRIKNLTQRIALIEYDAHAHDEGVTEDR